MIPHKHRLVDKFAAFLLIELLSLTGISGFVAYPQSCVSRTATSIGTKLYSSRHGVDLYEKDVVEFLIGDDTTQIQALDIGWKGSRTMLGSILELQRSDGLTSLQPLCVREEGSTELYGDSRLEPILVSADRILRVCVLSAIVGKGFHVPGSIS